MEDTSAKKDATSGVSSLLDKENESAEIHSESEGKDSGTGISDSESNRDSLNLEDFEKVNAEQIQQMAQESGHEGKSHTDAGDMDFLGSAKGEKTYHDDFDPLKSSESGVKLIDAPTSLEGKTAVDPFTVIGGGLAQEAPSQGYSDSLLSLSSSPGRAHEDSSLRPEAPPSPASSDGSFGHLSGEEKVLKDAPQRDPSPAGIQQQSPALLMETEHPPPLKEPAPPPREPSPLSSELAYALKESAPVDDSPSTHKPPTPSLQEPILPTAAPALPSKEPTPPPKAPTPPPKEPTPLPKEPTPPPKEPSPPPKEPTPSKEPTPPPKEPTPPPKEPTPPPKEPTPPPPKEPTPPPKKPTPPPKEPTPPPKEPTPLPKEPTPPPKEPTPPPKEPSPVKEQILPALSSPVKSSFPTIGSSSYDSSVGRPLQEPTISQGKPSSKVRAGPPSPVGEISSSLKRSLALFQPRAWFNPDQLDPRVVNLIYWRDVKKTGIVFGSIMVVLLSLTYLSLISVVAYTSLVVLTGTIAFRIYKNIMQAIQKSQDGHPFKDYLELDTNLQPDKVHEAADVFISQVNSTVSELKRLFLVEDLIDSVKFGCLLWCLTYVGSWFNGLTLVNLSVVALFTLPKVYEQNKAQIDQYLGLVWNQVSEITTKVKAAIPIGGKEKAQ